MRLCAAYRRQYGAVMRAVILGVLVVVWIYAYSWFCWHWAHEDVWWSFPTVILGFLVIAALLGATVQAVVERWQL
jgi:hypothetical protein